MCRPIEHPFLPKDFPSGMYSDDTQLSLAVSRGICLTLKRPSLIDNIVEQHIAAFKESTVGKP